MNIQTVGPSEKLVLNHQSTWQHTLCQLGYFTREGDSTRAEGNLYLIATIVEPPPCP